MTGRGQRAVAVGVALALLLAAGAWAVLRAGVAPSGPLPHIVLVVVCSLRRDQLTPYGGHPDASPVLQALAERGTRFTGAVTAAPWTRPASAAIWTGHHAPHIGMIEPGGDPNRRRLAEEVTTLAERLRAAGYQTFGATGNPNTNRINGFAQGFEHYEQITKLFSKGGRKVSGHHLVTLLLRTFDRHRDRARPAFVQVMLLDPHGPLRKDKRWKRFTGPDDPTRLGRYRAAVHEADRHIGRLFRQLRKRGLADEDTYWMVINDHGDGLYHPNVLQGFSHGAQIVSSVVDMPWIASGPGIPAGATAAGVASQVDVVPTVLGLAGIGGYAGPGIDHTAALRTGGRTDREHAYVSTRFRTARKTAVYSETRTCIVDFEDHSPQRQRRIRAAWEEELGALPEPSDKAREERRLRQAGPAPGTVQCYDLAADRYPMTPLPDADPDLSARLAAGREAAQAAYQAWPHTTDVATEPAMEQQLRALGYATVDEEE